MKKNQGPSKGTWVSRGLALLLPFLLLSLVAWTADGQDPRGKAGVLDCDPMTACFLDLVLKLATNRMQRAPCWSPISGDMESRPRTTVDPPPNIIVILADDMGFNDISLYNGETTSTVPTPEIDALAAQGVCLHEWLCGQRDVCPLESRPRDRQVFYPIRL